MKKVPEYSAVRPITLACPRCKAGPNEACDMLDDVLALIHLERIEAAVSRNQAAKAQQKRPYSAFVDWMARQAKNGVKFLTMEDALIAFDSRNVSDTKKKSRAPESG
jgi:hypothetical protein